MHMHSSWLLCGYVVLYIPLASDKLQCRSGSTVWHTRVVGINGYKFLSISILQSCLQVDQQFIDICDSHIYGNLHCKTKKQQLLHCIMGIPQAHTHGGLVGSDEPPSCVKGPQFTGTRDSIKRPKFSNRAVKYSNITVSLSNTIQLLLFNTNMLKYD